MITHHIHHYIDNHPATVGHFVNRPIIPGVAILADVLAAIQTKRATGSAFSLRAAKFLRPVTPGQYMSITLEEKLNTKNGVAIHFECTVDQAAVAKGTFDFELIS